MTVVTLQTPKGAPIIATLERVSATCGIVGFNLATKEPEYDGSGASIDWDSQEQVRNYRGSRMFLDEDGKCWSFEELTQVAVEEKVDA